MNSCDLEPDEELTLDHADLVAQFTEAEVQAVNDALLSNTGEN